MDLSEKAFYTLNSCNVKRSFNLLEIIIGTVLSAILLTTLFSNLRHLLQTNTNLEKVRQEMHWQFITELRLNQVFENIKEPATFYTAPYKNANLALHFVFNNGLDKDPELSGEIQGTLYLRKNKTFTLLLKQKRQEALCKQVEELRFAFFDPKSAQYVSEWKGGQLPPFIKIYLGKKTFTFFLPKAHFTLDYS